MQDLADAGADSAAGGLDGLYGDGGGAGAVPDTDGLPEFFRTGGGGGGGDSGGFDPLADFGAGGQGDGDGAAALFASLGLPVAGAGSGTLDGSGEGGGGGGGGGDGGGADQSEWALMQRQFEDMNKSFLQE